MNYIFNTQADKNIKVGEQKVLPYLPPLFGSDSL